MVNWLAKAKGALRRAPPPEPEPYDVACVCSHRLSGMRASAFQVLRCNRCGNYVFVLPSDVYPKPKPKKKAPPKTPPAIRGSSTPPPSLPGVAPSGSPRGSVAGRGGGAAASAPAAAAPATQPAVATSGSSDEIRLDAVELTIKSSLFTPVRIIACAIFAVVVLTGYFIWQSQRKEKAALTLREHLEAGEAAFKESKFAEAATEYQQAAHAVDILGRDDAESRAVRQKAKELNALAHLASLSLYELCDAARLAVTEKDTQFGERFDRLHRDSWIVVEGDVVSDTGPDGTPQPLIRYPFPIDGATPVILDARLKALEPTSAVAGPQHVIFAGQLDSFKEEGTKSKVWVLRLKNATAFLWVGADTYGALGLGTDALRNDDETARLLAAQAEIVGVKP